MSQFSRALEQARRDRAQHVTGPTAAPPVRAATPGSEAGPPARPLAEPAVAPIYRIDDHLVSLLAPASFVAEQYRGLRLVVEQAHRASGFSVVGVSSPDVGDGKTTTAINLAGALSQGSDARVLLVDMDLRRPTVGARLGLGGPERPGLVDAVLDPRLTLRDVARPLSPFNFSVLLAGRRASAPYELLKAPRLGGLMEQARQAYDYVVMDTPPFLPMPDCQIIGKWVDSFLVVLACDKTPRRLLAEALNVLAPDKVLGLVFNRSDQQLSSYSYVDESRAHREARWSRAAKRVTGSLRPSGRWAPWR